MSGYESTTSRFPKENPPQCVLIEDLLPLYIEGEVSHGTRDVIAEHLAQCEHCAGFLAGAQSVRFQLRQDQQARNRVVANDRPAFGTMHALQFIAVVGGVLATGMVGFFFLAFVNAFGLYDIFSIAVPIVAGIAAVCSAWMLLNQWRNAQPMSRRQQIGTMVALTWVGLLMLFVAVLLIQYTPFGFIRILVDVFGPLFVLGAVVVGIATVVGWLYMQFNRRGQTGNQE